MDTILWFRERNITILRTLKVPMLCDAYSFALPRYRVSSPLIYFKILISVNYSHATEV